MAYSVGFSARDVRSLPVLLALLGWHSGLSVVCVNGTMGPIPNMTKRLLVLGRRWSMAIVQKVGVLCARDEGTEEGAGLRVVALQCRRGAAPRGSGSEREDDLDLDLEKSPSILKRPLHLTRRVPSQDNPPKTLLLC
jgi:hypothetical protein